MCGIIAALSTDAPWRERAVVSGLRGLRHRGDRGGTAASLDLPEYDCALGTVRLSIVGGDLGRQPIRSPSGRYVLVMNGEAFNYRALARSLRVEGISDTRVVAAALDAWGPERTAIKLNWEGAFLCLDRHEGLLWAVRDHLGVKPLYRACAEHGIVFASEIKALTALGARDIVPVQPGGILAMSTMTRSLTREAVWWNYAASSPEVTDDDDRPEPASDLRDAVDELLRGAVRSRVPSGRYAIALSGGLDSSLVLHYAIQVHDAVTAYVLATDASPDLNFARRLCQLYSVPLVEVNGDDADALRTRVAETVATVESWEWHVLNHAAPMRPLLRRMRDDGHRVVLTGEVADELFLGYELPVQINPHISRRLARDRSKRLHDLHRTNCRRLDRMGMRYALECRVPFLDRSLVEYAWRIPPAALVNPAANKSVLRKVAARRLPQGFAQRPKLSLAKGSGYRYGAGEVRQSVFGEGDLGGARQPLPPAWRSLPRFPLERAFLAEFLDLGYGSAGYLRSRST